ncbi:MAG: hypothetical protein IJV82_05165 [Oscillospiraceae bacterium]|nr:hypothetical protein [Oscillospiraceae bacterium]
MKMKNLLALALAFVLMLCLCACGKDDSGATEGSKAPATEGTTAPVVPSTEATDPVTEPSAEATDPTTAPTVPSLTTEPSSEVTEPSDEITEPTTAPSVPDFLYAITVKSVDGTPLSGVFVQLCRGESCCSMGTTGADGTAYYTEELVGEGSLTAKIIVMPEGYQYSSDVQVIELAAGEKVAVFELVPVAG